MGVSSLRCLPDSRLTHLRNWFAFTPALRASPDTDTPGLWHTSISRRLSSGSKRRTAAFIDMRDFEREALKIFWGHVCVRKLVVSDASLTFLSWPRQMRRNYRLTPVRFGK